MNADNKYAIFWLEKFNLQDTSRTMFVTDVFWHMYMCMSSVQFFKQYIDGLVQDCSNSSANALELLQTCTQASIHRL